MTVIHASGASFLMTVPARASNCGRLAAQHNSPSGTSYSSASLAPPPLPSRTCPALRAGLTLQQNPMQPSLVAPAPFRCCDTAPTSARSLPSQEPSLSSHALNNGEMRGV